MENYNSVINDMKTFFKPTAKAVKPKAIVVVAKVDKETKAKASKPKESDMLFTPTSVCSIISTDNKEDKDEDEDLNENITKLINEENSHFEQYLNKLQAEESASQGDFFAEFLEQLNSATTQANTTVDSVVYLRDYADGSTKNEETLSFEQIKDKIDENKMGYECIYGPVVPYYDWEQVHNTNDEMKEKRKEELKSCMEKLRSQFGSDARIISFDACGMCVNKETKEKKYKTSFHFIVRNVGYYKSGSLVPRLEGFDASVYKAANSRQCFRLPYCAKDGKTRFLKRLTDSDTKLDSWDECEDELSETIADYIIQNTNGEQLIHVEETTTTTTKSSAPTRNNVSFEAMSDLLDCFLDVNQKQKYSWEEFAEIIWCVISEGTANDFDYKQLIHGFASKSSKYNKSETDKMIQSARDCNSGKKIKTIGTLLFKLKGLYPQKAQEWFVKHAKKITIDRNDNYIFSDFQRYYSSVVFASLAELNKTFYNDCNRVLAKVLQGRGFYIKKEDTDDQIFNIVDGLANNDPCNFTIRYKVPKSKKQHTITDGKKQIKEIQVDETEEIKFLKMLDSSRVNTYSKFVCKPDGCLDHEFNVWTGFKAKIVKPINMKLIQPMLDYIKSVWCCNDEKMYQYLLSWLALTVQKPGSPVQVAFFVYSEQGCGKNTLTDFLTDHVLGESVCGVANQVNDVVRNFNTSLLNKKFYLINEMGATKEEFKNNFDKLKHLVTEKTINIEPKGRDSYKVPNFMNWIMVSNNRDAIYLDESDRRYCCIEISNEHMNDHKYFGDLRKKCFNDEVGNHFFTYLMNYDCVDVREIPMTKLKESIKQLSKSNMQLFEEHFAEQIKLDKDDREAVYSDISGSIASSIIYDLYRRWCDANGHRGVVTNTKFGMFISTKYEKRKAHGVMKYDLVKS